MAPLTWVCSVKAGSVEAAVGEVFSHARNELRIMVPYITLGQARALLAQLSLRPKGQFTFLKVITSGAARNYLQGASSLDALGLIVHAVDPALHVEVRAITSLHAKVYLADEKMAFVGSANLTDGGMGGNIEAGVVTEDPGVIRAIWLDFEQLWQNAGLVTPDLIARAAIDLGNHPDRTESDAGARALFGTDWRPPRTPGSPTKGAAKDHTYKGTIIKGIPRKALDLFILNKPLDEEELERNVKAFRGLNPRLKLLGSAVAQEMRLPADGDLAYSGWFYYPATRPFVPRYPGHWWVALGRNDKAYLPWAQLSFGIYARPGQRGGFAGFLLNEDGQANNDRRLFQRGVREHLHEFVEMVHALPQEAVVGWRGTDGREVEVAAQKLSEEEATDFSQPDRRKRNLRIELYYPEGTGDFFDNRIVNFVADRFKKLYPFYHLALKGRFPGD